MPRRVVPSMSFPAFLDVVVTPRVVGVTNYVEIAEADYLADPHGQDSAVDPIRSLRFDDAIRPGELPPTATGVFHRRFPCARLVRPLVRGEALSPGLAGRYFRARSFSVLDLDDPSLGASERGDGAVWTLGIDYEGYLRPIYNALAYEGDGGMHPLRSTRQLGAPSCLFLYQPFPDVPLDECGATLKANRSLGYRSNVEWSPGSFDYVDDYLAELPALRVLSGGGEIAPDAEAEVVVEVVDPEGRRLSRDVDLLVDSSGGLVPLRRVVARDGSASLRVVALALRDGDRFSLSIGIGSRRRLASVDYLVRKA